MLHAVFQTAQIMPMNTQVRTKTLSPKPSLPIPILGPLKPVIKPAAVKLRRRALVVKAWYPAEVGNDSASILERCFVAPLAPGSRDSSSPPSSSPPSSSMSLSPIMKGGEYGAFGTMTLEKSKLDMTQRQTRSSPERLYGFAICFVAGLTCTLLSMLVFLKPIKFAMTFTLGNLLSLGSTAFLIGPKRQVTMMLDPVRIYATTIYLASMIIALFCALYVHIKLLTLLAIILEFGALVWYFMIVTVTSFGVTCPVGLKSLHPSTLHCTLLYPRLNFLLTSKKEKKHYNEALRRLCQIY